LLRDFFTSFTEEEITTLISFASDPTYTKLDSSTLRKKRKNLSKELQEIGIQNPQNLAHSLLKLGLDENWREYKHIILHPLAEKKLGTAKQLANLYFSANTIQVATESATKVIKAMKSYLRHDSGELMTPNSLEKSIDTALILHHGLIKRGVAVIKKIEVIPDIICLKDELSQVWMNLIHNALHAMNFEGVLTISIKIEDSFVKISFQDTGIGIPTELKPKIFTPFFTTKPDGEGSGLGLDIVVKIIEKHHGHISFDSEEGKGTVFHVYLPVSN
jgi:signal transduction histidine kinase